MHRYIVQRHHKGKTEIVCARMELGGKTLHRHIDYWFERSPVFDYGNHAFGLQQIALFTKIADADDLIEKFMDAGYDGDYRVVTRFL